MRFLLTNDDGIQAPGLALLESLAGELGDVTVVAPDRRLSGCSHRVTVDAPLVAEPRGPNRFALNGTSADCTRIALVELGVEADWVLSGINDGANLGVDVYMSGTVGAVREAGLFGVPGMALSLYRHYNGPFDWGTLTGTARRILAELITRQLDPGGYLNVNFPDPRDAGDDSKLVICPLDPHPLPVAYVPAGQGVRYQIDYHQRSRDPGTDVDVCFSGQVAVTEVLPTCASHARADSAWLRQE